MHGSLTVASRAGEGSTFSVTLQSASEDADRSTASMDALETASEAAPPTRTIVYIEDNAVNQKVLERALMRRPQLQVLPATHPEAGITLVQSQLPDLVLLDINLPGMNGFEVIEILKQDPRTRSIPVIAFSANVLAEDIERSQEYGFADYLTKPIDFKLLYRVLDKHLGSASPHSFAEPGPE